MNQELQVVDFGRFKRYVVSRAPGGFGGIRAELHFDNGYGASVIYAPGSYGLELAVLVAPDWKLCYTTPITNDVVGDLTPDTLIETLDAIMALPKFEVPAKDYRVMSISEIAQEIRKDWRNVNFGAKPYLCAMMGLNSVDDMYGYDTGRSVVTYFLCNANTWKGETARAIKKELNRRIK